MADKRINQLPAGTTPLAGTEVLAIDTPSGTKQVTAQDVADLAAGGFPAFSTLTDAGTSYSGDWLILDRGLADNYLRVDTHNLHTGAIASMCKNVSGGQLAKGTPVYQVSVAGQMITVAAADASDPAKMPAIGVLNQTLADQAEGEILFLGSISNVNTGSFAPGDAVYVAVGGGYTNVRPSPPNISQYLGVVLKANNASGSGQILGTGVADAAIANLADTTITSPTNGQVLSYNNATSKWVNSAAPVPAAAGADTQVQYNASNAFAGDAGLTYNATTKALTVGGAIVTTSTPVLSLSQTWNNIATTFTGIDLNVTDTTSASASLLANLRVGGVSQFSVRKDGILRAVNSVYVTAAAATGITATSNVLSFVSGGSGVGQFTATEFRVDSSKAIGFSSTTNAWTGAPDVLLHRDAAANLALRNGTNAQIFRVYNTESSSLANYERGTFGWTSNVLRIGTEKTGTGLARPLELRTDGTLALTITTAQKAEFAATIKTAAPVGGTAAEWKLGTVASVTPTSPNRTIEVEIGGTTYYLAAKTTNN